MVILNKGKIEIEIFCDVNGSERLGRGNAHSKSCSKKISTHGVGDGTSCVAVNQLLSRLILRDEKYFSLKQQFYS